MRTVQSLTFQWTWWSAAAGVAIVCCAVAVCFLAWRRSGYARGAGMLEGLRLLILSLLVVTLLQPEWLVEHLPEEKPTIVVLGDASRSMETRDVDSPTAASIISRAESIRPLLSKELWANAAGLGERFEIVFEPFSSRLSQPSEGTDLSSALGGALERHANLAAIVLATDGDWNTGDPPARAAAQMRMRKIPAFVLPVGSESRLPDLELARVDAPTFAVLGKPLRIPFVVESSLPRDTTTTLTLAPSSGEAVTTQFTVPAHGQWSDTILWTPKEKGEFKLTVSLPVDGQETIPENNQRVVPISIGQEELKALFVESYPRWEYRYIRNALERDPGVEVSCLLFHPGLSKVGGGKGYLGSFPKNLDELSAYDVIFLGDVGVEAGQLTEDNLRLIKAVVQSHAGGLVWMPGLRGAHQSFIGSELEDLYPVVLDKAQPRGWGSRAASQMELTETGRRSLLTQLEDSEETNAQLWESLPGFQWHAAALRVRAGSEVLAVHKSESTLYGRVPLIAIKTFGTGKILYIGTDATWRWREGVEDKYHYRFWGQVVRWMAYQRSMAHGELMRLFFLPDRPQSGSTVTLHANVMGQSGEPLSTGQVLVQVVPPSGKTETVRLSPQDEWGLFTGQFTPREAGKYHFTLTCRENSSSLEASLAVENVQRERLGQPVRTEVLAEIASVTGGKLAKMGDLNSLMSTISALPDPSPLVKRLRIWCHPAWAGILVFLMGVFWTGRKLTGVI
jgi:uncharacterized membrane protein